MDSDGFREVRNGVRSFVCVISVRGLSSLYAWLCGSVGIFATSLGFVRCFRKPLSISQVNFVAWRPFHSLEVISQPMAIFAAKGQFRSPFRIYGSVGLRNGTRVPRECFATAKIFVGGSYGAAVDPQFCPPNTCPIRYLFDTLQ